MTGDDHFRVRTGTFSDRAKLKNAVDTHIEQCSNKTSAYGVCALMLGSVEPVYAFAMHTRTILSLLHPEPRSRAQLSPSHFGHPYVHVYLLTSHRCLERRFLSTAKH